MNRQSRWVVEVTWASEKGQKAVGCSDIESVAEFGSGLDLPSSRKSQPNCPAILGFQ